MKMIIALVGLLAAAAALPASDLLSEDWKSFKITHKRSYTSIDEELKRLAIYQDNLKKIEAHNKEFNEGETTYMMGVNKFADWTAEEFLGYVNKNNISKPLKAQRKLYAAPKGAVVPDEFDWRTQGVVTPIKDQRACGCGWAFSAVGALEGQLAIKTGKLVSLSEQNLVDCSSSYGNEGCNGGLPDYAFEYVRDNGINSEQDYPYQANNSTCNFVANKSVLNISGIVDIPAANETELVSSVATAGPISVALWASANLQFYVYGVYIDFNCRYDQSNHEVLVVGYGYDHYIMKNSWGDGWGENGYIRWRRDINLCGVANQASYPIY